MAAGERVVLETSLRNRSTEVWSSDTLPPIFLSYRWLDADGNPVPAEGLRGAEGLRSRFPEPVTPEALVEVKLLVEAPPTPGDYILELDPVFEHVAWFSERNGGTTLRYTVTVYDAELDGDQR